MHLFLPCILFLLQPRAEMSQGLILERRFPLAGDELSLHQGDALALQAQLQPDERRIVLTRLAVVVQATGYWIPSFSRNASNLRDIRNGSTEQRTAVWRTHIPL